MSIVLNEHHEFIHYLQNVMMKARRGARDLHTRHVSKENHRRERVVWTSPNMVSRVFSSETVPSFLACQFQDSKLA
jgi:hypothetical protein